MHKLVYISSVLVILIVAFGLFVYTRYISTKPLTPAELAMLTPDWDAATRGNWSPWWDRGDGTIIWNPAAGYNEWVERIPEDERAWPMLLDAIYAHTEYMQRDAIAEHLGTYPIDPHGWALLHDDLADPEGDALMSELINLSKKPYMGGWLSNTEDPLEHAWLVRLHEQDPENFTDPSPDTFDPDANTNLSGSHTPWLTYQRTSTNFLLSKGAFELEQGNTELFVEAMESLMRLSDQTRDFPNIISTLVEIAIESLAIQRIDWGISAYPDRFDEALLGRLADATQHADGSYIWQGEAMQFHDTLRRLCDNNGRLGLGMSKNSRLGGAGSLGDPISLPDTQLHASMQRALLVNNKLLQGLNDASGLDWDPQAESSQQVFEREKKNLNSMTSLFIDFLVPSLDQTAATLRQHRQSIIGVRLGLAAHIHQRRHGVFPTSIDEIDKDLINFDPIDAFTGEQLRYVLTDSGPLVYSVGDDRIDNGGQQGWIENRGYNDEVYHTKASVQWLSPEQAQPLGDDPSRQWDWVLFPVPPDEPEPIDDSDPDWDLHEENGG